MLSRKVVSLFLVLLFLVVTNVFGQSSQVQFGKNNVRYNQLDQFYESHRFDVWHNLDRSDPVQDEYLRYVVDNLENARDWGGGSKIFGHSIEKRVPVFLYKNFTDMEASNLIGGFAPEGLGALVDFERKRMLLRGDFSTPLGRAIRIHELMHEFQLDIYNPNIIQRAVGSVSLPNGYFEGCAEFLAGLYDPHTRDDIRRREQRAFASNPKSLPTWEVLNSGRINPYTMWSMIPEFLEDKFSGGVAFCTQPLKNKVGLGEFIYDLAKDELGNPDINSEKFDQKARHYWGAEKGFEIDGINRPKPYEENDNFKGWTVTPYGHPYKMLSPVISADGSQIAAFTIQKNGVALVRYDIPKETVYLSKEEREKSKNNGVLRLLRSEPDLVKNLTPQLPPVPWEYLIVQGFETWSTFNGSDLDWWQDPNWIAKVNDVNRDLEDRKYELAELNRVSDKEKAKDHSQLVANLQKNIEFVEKNLREFKQIPDVNKIAFFARINRDHALVIVDAENGEVLRKIEFELPGLQLDQAFSPSFSPDGKKVYFSAARNITRDLYVVDLESGEVVNLTNDERFDTAPRISPDGSKVAYVGSDGDFQHLFILHLVDGLKEQLTFGQFNDSSPSWSDDGSTLVYSSDEADMIWNLYTFDFATRTVSQWTEFVGEVKTPLFVRGSLNTVYYAVFHDDDQHRDQIYQNYEIFAAGLKKPIRQYTAVDKGEPNIFAFNPNRDLFRLDLDSNQLLNPKEPPERWDCGSGGVSIGASQYWGMFSQSYLGCSNMLETKRHLGLFALYGHFKIFDYSYLNQEKRTSWRWGAHHYQTPFSYQFYDIVKRYPKQVVLNNTWMKESAVDLFTEYPINKFNRWELFSKLRHRSFNVFGVVANELDEAVIADFPDIYTDQDLQMYRFLRTSSGSSLSFSTAYVRDTVLSCSSTWGGPCHGNALRGQFEVAPPLGKGFHSYYSTNIQARTYKLLGNPRNGVIFAGRVDLMATSRANGDFMLLCGPERLRGCEYGSIAGNEVAYGSVELRFPIPGTYLLYQDIRGLLFADGASARFSDERFPAQKAKAYGLGLQYIIPFMGLPAQSIWKRENGRWNHNFYVTLNW